MNVYDKYINFNQIVDDMIRNHSDNLMALESLEEMYAELKLNDGVRAIQYDSDRVQTSVNADEMVNLAIQKEMLEKRIKELQEEERIFKKAWDALTQEEQQVLDLFLRTGIRKQEAVDMICDRLHCERATAYRRKDLAVRRFKRLMFG